MKTPSPQLGRRSTRSNKTFGALPVPALQELGPETQSLLEDSQGDPDYIPSQLLDAVVSSIYLFSVAGYLCFLDLYVSKNRYMLGWQVWEFDYGGM